jgi:hypothetical protein
VLSPQAKWEIFLQVTSRELTQADAARNWQVDVSTVIGIRKTVKDAALAALAVRPGRPAKERDWELERARAEIPLLLLPLTAATCAAHWSLVRSRGHYPSDVLVGGAVGVAVAVAGWWVWRPGGSAEEATEATETAIDAAGQLDGAGTNANRGGPVSLTTVSVRYSLPCLNDPTRQQINVLNEERLKERTAELGMTDIETIYVAALLTNHLMNEFEARTFLQETCPAVMETLCDVWNGSPMKNMTLTTVGITIAHANCRRILGESPADLSIWINLIRPSDRVAAQREQERRILVIGAWTRRE